jgi:hypothetical protein
MVELNFMLINDGSGTAEDTDIEIVVERGIDVITEDHIGQPPKEPRLPTDRSRLAYGAGAYTVPPIPGLTNLSPLNVPSATVLTTPVGSRIHFNVKRIKQTTRLNLNPVYALFTTDVKSFGMRYTLNSHSLPANVDGDLHVKLNQRS